ncbi:M1 family metallopeptidase [Wenzhouxiangella sp. XN201]|uniref:M1 family metallopeptidase n=1 Tax=Wenzhouxiangella sp. XN201 TaxID=2710755 RepID=UPI0013C66B56|nr:M1 family metallopeptidase [Wenzhouxiangella sp. XN201]NEZ02876.1 M1 family metallopeptidase [Wenzhouxiangella sp. XN201]
MTGRMNEWLLAAICILLLAACQGKESSESLAPAEEWQVRTGTDPHSFAEYEKVRVEHLRLDLDADMDAHVLSGYVRLDLERVDPDHPRLVLDTRGLDIRDVTAPESDGNHRPLSWSVGEEKGSLGRPLVILLPEGVEAVRIDFASSPEAFGLQWLDGEQTSSGESFMFSQSQPHYARTWVPLQDTPAVRYTFDATVRVPEHLMAVMGAAGNPFERNDSGEYRFHMPQPVPSYLMAIAIGDLEFAETGERSGVYAEPEWIEAAAEEFDVLEEMIDIGVDLYGEYRWGRYDLLVLPPSFPFGGMENPRLSFVTPTIIAGDGSLLALVAHELAHSWSGNLVTNAAWRDLWLNEGFTVYFESRIMEALYGEEVERQLAVLEWEGLVEELESTEDGMASLVLDVDERDPDDAFIGVPYAKGRFFLDWIEHRVGRAAIDEFLRAYFDHFAFESISTQTFRAYLENNLVSKHTDALSMDEVDQWLYQPGLPEYAVAPESDAFERVDDWRQRWLAGNAALDELPADQWSVYQWLHFLIGLEDELDGERMTALDAAFSLTDSDNYEILYQWLMRSIEARYEPGIERLEAFLLEVGRNKFTRPLYGALADTDWGRDWAIEVYERARPGYHPMTRQAAERALGLGD